MQIKSVLIFILGFISAILLGVGVVFTRIDMNKANSVAPVIIVIAAVLGMLYILILYKKKGQGAPKIKYVLCSVGLVLMGSWLFFIASVYLLQDMLIYNQQHIDSNRIMWVKNNFKNVEEVSLGSDDIKLNGWYIKNSNSEKTPLIIYFGGGAEDITKRIPDFVKIKGWSTVLINYRGYGLSEGKPSEKSILNDSLKIYDYFYNKNEVDKKRIVVMGRSLGTGAAVYLSDKRDVFKTILVSPYDSMTGWLQGIVPFVPASLVMKSPFDSLSYAPSIKNDVLCIIGEKDRSVYPSKSEKLISKWGGKSTTHTINGAIHDSILYNEGCWNYINEFLKNSLED